MGLLICQSTCALWLCSNADVGSDLYFFLLACGCAPNLCLCSVSCGCAPSCACGCALCPVVVQAARHAGRRIIPGIRYRKFRFTVPERMRWIAATEAARTVPELALCVRHLQGVLRSGDAAKPREESEALFFHAQLLGKRPAEEPEGGSEYQVWMRGAQLPDPTDALVAQLQAQQRLQLLQAQVQAQLRVAVAAAAAGTAVAGVAPQAAAELAARLVSSRLGSLQTTPLQALLLQQQLQQQQQKQGEAGPAAGLHPGDLGPGPAPLPAAAPAGAAGSAAAGAAGSPTAGPSVPAARPAPTPPAANGPLAAALVNAGLGGQGLSQPPGGMGGAGLGDQGLSQLPSLAAAAAGAAAAGGQGSQAVPSSGQVGHLAGSQDGTLGAAPLAVDANSFAAGEQQRPESSEWREAVPALPAPAGLHCLVGIELSSPPHWHADSPVVPIWCLSLP